MRNNKKHTGELSGDEGEGAAHQERFSGEAARGRLLAGRMARQRRHVLFSRSCLHGTYCHGG